MIHDDKDLDDAKEAGRVIGLYQAIQHLRTTKTLSFKDVIEELELIANPPKMVEIKVSELNALKSDLSDHKSTVATYAEVNERLHREIKNLHGQVQKMRKIVDGLQERSMIIK